MSWGGFSILAAGWASVPVAAAMLLVGWVIYAFNRLVRDRNLLREGWSGIDVQLNRRANLVPSLVEVVRGYARHESSTLQRVTELRAASQSAGRSGERAHSENALADQLRHLLALAESYPDLKANNSFLTLQEQLAEIEDQLQLARRYYNGATRNYNIRVESFPGNLVAKALGFGREEFFELESATQRTAPQVAL